jgi:hypothetical protein
MSRTAPQTIELSRSKQQRARARFFRDLAIGAGDPIFANKLHALAAEYEGAAARAEAGEPMESSTMPEKVEEGRVPLVGIADPASAAHRSRRSNACSPAHGRAMRAR